MNYKSEQLAGEAWVRSYKVILDNVFGVTPLASFYEEKIFSIGNGEYAQKPIGTIHESMTDPTKTFPLLDPTTGEPTGVLASYYDIYVALHSLYVTLATSRDVKIEEARLADEAFRNGG